MTMDIVEFDRISQLLKDENFKAELKVYKKSYQRLKVRLRNNKLVCQLKHLKNLIKKLLSEYPAELFIRQKLGKSNSKAVSINLKYISQFVRSIDTILDKIIFVYSETQPHYKVGHLVQHLIVIRSSIARLAFCFKALLVYSADLYLSLCQHQNSDISCADKPKILKYNEIKDILDKHNCKPREEQNNKQEPEVVLEVHKSEEIGQLIDRVSLRPRRCK